MVEWTSGGLQPGPLLQAGPGGAGYSGLFQLGFEGLQECKSHSLSGPLSQCLTTFMVKKYFHVSNQDFRCPHLHPQPLVAPWAPLRRVWHLLP